jgi:hypothetical protein
MDVNTEAISSILEELASIDISVSVIEGALALCHTVAPVAIVLCSILPELLTFSMLDMDLLLSFSIENKFHLTCIRGSFTYGEILFEVNLLTIYFFNVISISCF